MLLPDGTVLMHADAPYDPAKAHEYYLRYRQLHPRAKSAQLTKSKSTYTVSESGGKKVKLSAKNLQMQKVYAEHRVEQTTKRLHELKIVLRNKLEEAKAKNKAPTLADKAKAAREAEQYRKSHKQELRNRAKEAASKKSSSSSTASATKTKSKTDTVASLQADIVKTKANLKAAVAKQRELATAKKNG